MIELRHRPLTVVRPDPSPLGQDRLVGKSPRKACCRCGIVKAVRAGQMVASYMCVDCKEVDPEFGKDTEMARVSYAVRQLVEQVQAHRPDAAIEHSDEDGFGVYRTVSFGDATAAWLWPLLQPLDERFAKGELSNGVLTLTVQGRSTLADDASPFGGIPEPESAPDEPESLAGLDAEEPAAAEPAVKPKTTRKSASAKAEAGQQGDGQQGD